ncbi:MAG: hypothetical protein JW719_07585 [Pirellulales bacterium]|nr:hypothetical protein [Pirellulales bacterium]
MRINKLLSVILPLAICTASGAAAPRPDADTLAGQPADVAPSAYQYRGDRATDQNPPEGWILMMQYANLPYDKPVDTNTPAVKKALCGLLWEEVRPVRRFELSWPADAKNRPAPDQLTLCYFDGNSVSPSPWYAVDADRGAHIWWNPRTVKEAEKPVVSADGRTYVYTIPVDTWAVVAAVRGDKDAAAFAVPTIRAFGKDVWKQANVEIEWGFDDATAALDYSGRIEAYDGVVGDVRPLAGGDCTVMEGPDAWRSAGKCDARRGVRLSLLYIGTSDWRKEWPYTAQPEDVARTIVTVWTKSGSFSFLAADLARGPILAPEFGFYVRSTAGQQAASAREFRKELDAKGLKTIRQRVREHSEQTWEGAVSAMRGDKPQPPHPKPQLEPAMQVDVPCPRLTVQWKLGAEHLLRRSVKDKAGKRHFNDFPFGILASETYMILHALDLQGMHQEAADGLDQWLSLPTDLKIVPGQQGHHGIAKPDRPLGHFSEGRGCLTHAEGPAGEGGNMDGIHSMGPGAIMFALVEHFRLTGDTAWLKRNAPRMKANVEWILRQRQLLSHILPGGGRLWSKGLQPAHVVTPDSMCMHMQFYESEAYYWLAVKNMAELLALVDPAAGVRLAAEAEAYRKDLLASIDRSIALTPVVAVRDGTYHSFIPFAPYVRGFASGTWGWRRCQGHVGALYWDTVQSADPLVSPSGLLATQDPRVQGHLDVLEDRLLIENPKVHERTPGFNPEKHWFSHASWQYQCGLERHANIHLMADDAPNFLRSMLNQYAVDIMPGEYTFREHTVGGPPDKSFEESCFLERFRNMLVVEDGETLWLAKAAPRVWLEQGRKIAVQNAPTHFGTLAYEIVSDVDHGRINATVELPTRNPPKTVLLRFRHPKTAPIQGVTVNGKEWAAFDKKRETITLENLAGEVAVTARY